MGQPVTYIKLAPYLASYWRKVMGLKPDEPLVLPNMEMRQYFSPQLKYNKTLFRSPSRNDKGYLKDASSFCQYAYELSTSSSIKDLNYSLKIPTPSECADLQPFLIPKNVIDDKTIDLQYIEVRDRGVARIRTYIRDFFYAELHAHVLQEQRKATRLNKIADTSYAIEVWLLNLNIISDDSNFDTTKENIRRRLYEYDEKHFHTGDPDSIRRYYYGELKKRHFATMPSMKSKKSIN